MNMNNASMSCKKIDREDKKRSRPEMRLCRCNKKQYPHLIFVVMTSQLGVSSISSTLSVGAETGPGSRATGTGGGAADAEEGAGSSY